MYLTREMMSALQLSLYWKRGVELRQSKEHQGSWHVRRADRSLRYGLAAELPQRFEWSYQLLVPAPGALTDSLVLVFRTAEGRISARVAARL